MLSTSHLVVRGVDVDAEALQRTDHRLTQRDRAIRRVIEVGAPVVGRTYQRPGGIALEQKELDLRADAIVETEALRPAQRSEQGAPGVSGVWLAVRRRRPADQPGRRAGRPREPV